MTKAELANNHQELHIALIALTVPGWDWKW